MSYHALDLSQAHSGPQGEQRRLRAADLTPPGARPTAGEATGWRDLAGRVVAARQAGRPVIWMMGAQVVTAGLGLLVSDLLQRGIVTHMATDGAGSSHDFELGVAGETGLDARGGLSAEVVEMLHAAIRGGVRDGLGWGEALGRILAGGAHPQREASVAYRAYALGLPLTVHATLGLDGLARHPACDFGALGWASGQDFKILSASVAGLEGGVFLNVGAGEMGEGLLQSALAAARSLGYPVADFAAFRLDFAPERPRAVLDLCALLTAAAGDTLAAPPGQEAGKGLEEAAVVVARRSPPAAAVLEGLVARHADLDEPARDLARAYLAIAHSLERGGTLFLCGNGGSMADALHISGEMLKSYVGPRPLLQAHRSRLAQQRNGEALAANLEPGLRAVVLGVNASLTSAVNNDFAARDLSYAQELYALARSGDVFLGISTSGKAANVGSAASVARALGLTTIGLTGPGGGPLAEQVDVAIRAPGARTDRIQEQHVVLYHALCEMLEVDFFGSALHNSFPH